ncbi:MAG: hypothetical protein RID91_16125 [Azospirillaceae bacterium]
MPDTIVHDVHELDARVLDWTPAPLDRLPAVVREDLDQFRRSIAAIPQTPRASGWALLNDVVAWAGGSPNIRTLSRQFDAHGLPKRAHGRTVAVRLVDVARLFHRRLYGDPQNWR